MINKVRLRRRNKKREAACRSAQEDVRERRRAARAEPTEDPLELAGEFLSMAETRLYDEAHQVRRGPAVKYWLKKKTTRVKTRVRV